MERVLQARAVPKEIRAIPARLVKQVRQAQLVRKAIRASKVKQAQ